METITAPYPQATKAAAMVMLCQVGLMILMDGKGPKKIKETAKIIFPNKDTIVGYFALSQI